MSDQLIGRKPELAVGATIDVAETFAFMWWSKRRKAAVGVDALVGSLVEETIDGQRLVPPSVLSHHDEVDVGLLVGRLAAGAGAVQPDRPELVSELVPEELDEAVERPPLGVGQRGLGERRHAPTVDARPTRMRLRRARRRQIRPGPARRRP